MLYLSPLWNKSKASLEQVAPDPTTPSFESLLRVPNDLLKIEQKELQRSFEKDFQCKKLMTNQSDPLTNLETTMALEVMFWTCLFKLIKLKVLPYKMFYNALKFGDSSIACKIIGNNIKMMELIEKDCDAKKVHIQKSKTYQNDRGFLIEPVFIHKVVEEIMKGRKEEKKELTYEEDLLQIVASTSNKNSKRAENNVKKESDASTQTEVNEVCSNGSSDSKEHLKKTEVVEAPNDPENDKHRNAKNEGDKVETGSPTNEVKCDRVSAPMVENSEEKTDSKTEKLSKDEGNQNSVDCPTNENPAAPHNTEKKQEKEGVLADDAAKSGNMEGEKQKDAVSVTASEVEEEQKKEEHETLAPSSAKMEPPSGNDVETFKTVAVSPEPELQVFLLIILLWFIAPEKTGSKTKKSFNDEGNLNSVDCPANENPAASENTEKEQEKEAASDVVPEDTLGQDAVATSGNMEGEEQKDAVPEEVALEPETDDSSATSPEVEEEQKEEKKQASSPQKEPSSGNNVETFKTNDVSMEGNSKEQTDSTIEEHSNDEATDKSTNDRVAQLNKEHALKMAKMIAEHNEEMRAIELEGNARSRERREEWRRTEEAIHETKQKCIQESLEAWRTLLEALKLKCHLDECKYEWEVYLDTVRGPVEAFQSQVNKIKYRRDLDTSQETFRKQLHNIWNHGYTAYHHLVENFDYLKGVSEQHPDKLFLRILMSKMSAMATAFCLLIDSFEDQSSRSTLFDQINPSDIPSTDALQNMCVTANAHDYDVILPPKTLKSVVEIVDLNEEVESDL